MARLLPLWPSNAVLMMKSVTDSHADFPAKLERELQERRAIKRPRPLSELLCRNTSPRVIRSDTAALTGQRRSRGGRGGKNTVIGAYHGKRGFPAAEGRVNMSSRQPVRFLHGSENKPAATFAAF